MEHNPYLDHPFFPIERFRFTVERVKHSTSKLVRSITETDAPRELCAIWVRENPFSTDPFGATIPMQTTGLKSDAVSLGMPPARLGLGRDMVPLVIFRTLRPICILSVARRYLLPLLFWIFVLYLLLLTRWVIIVYMFFCGFHREMLYCYHNSTHTTCVLRRACYAWWAS